MLLSSSNPQASRTSWRTTTTTTPGGCRCLSSSKRSTGVTGQYDTRRISSMAATTNKMRGQSEIHPNPKLLYSSTCVALSSSPRARAMASRTVVEYAIPIINPNLIKPPPISDQTTGGPTVGSLDSSPTGGNGTLFLNPRQHQEPPFNVWPLRIHSLSTSAETAVLYGPYPQNS
jgi:hypothetical protein